MGDPLIFRLHFLGWGVRPDVRAPQCDPADERVGCGALGRVLDDQRPIEDKCVEDECLAGTTVQLAGSGARSMDDGHEQSAYDCRSPRHGRGYADSARSSRDIGPCAGPP